MREQSISILDGSTFIVSDELGDVDAAPGRPHGLFHRDTRFLSRWRLTLDGRPLEVLSTDEVDYFSAQFFLTPPTGTIYHNPYLSVIRQRFVGEGMHEDVIVINHHSRPVSVELRVEAEADFADLFEVKDRLEKRGRLYREVRDERLVLGYRREKWVRETIISATAQERRVDAGGVRFRVELEAGGSWQTCLVVTPVIDRALEVKYTCQSFGKARPNMRQHLGEWVREAPALESDWDSLLHTYERSLIDLAALRFYPEILPGTSLPAAGLPWFMTLFGRDSLITSYQALPFLPELARTTLRVLAARQAVELDHFRDSEPGKILHELRFGELTAFGERPHSPYFGTADATPLFLVLLDEYERWSGDRELVRELERSARAALEWIECYGDRDGDGYVEYQRRNTDTGLENQCWKDSHNSILFTDGSLAKPPIATCEIQGYVYDAKRRCARLARDVWGDEQLAARLEQQAAVLKTAFNDDFWLAERRCYALALDRDKRQVDSLSSNVGHLLWSGIVDEGKAPALAAHLLGEDLFSGWGVRTMAAGEGGYNPIEYHNGTVWPHDNSLIAAGLARYGFREQSATIAQAMIEAAAHFHYRLPEVFAGYPRSLTHFPVRYPTASSPQAWAAAAPLLLIRVMLALEPDGDTLASEPWLPDAIARLELRGIPGRWGRTDVRRDATE